MRCILLLVLLLSSMPVLGKKLQREDSLFIAELTTVMKDKYGIELHAKKSPKKGFHQWSYDIGDNGRIRQIDISDCGLHAIPFKILQYRDLTVLDAQRNRISYIPPDIENLQKLTRLDLSRNRLDSLPDEIGNLPNLGWINLKANNLQTIPRSLDRQLGECYSDDWIALNPLKSMGLPYCLRSLYRKRSLEALRNSREGFLTFQHTGGKPLGYSLEVTGGWGFFSYSNTRRRMKHWRILAGKGMHIFAEPGVNGIRAGGGLNFMPFDLLINDPELQGQFSFRATATYFWDKRDYEGYGGAVFVGPEFGFTQSFSLRFGYLKELKGDRKIYSIQAGFTPLVYILMRAWGG